jgi:hypothetical protein
MKQETSPSHVAVLVPSVRKAAEYLRQFSFAIGEKEEFEETREIYIEGGEKNALLPMEAKESGSYQRALKKRGPGLHHLAIDVLDIESFLGSLAGTGWLMHLNSVKALRDFRTVYLARPGFPALIEVHEKKKLKSGSPFVEGVTLPLGKDHAGLVSAVGLDDILQPSNGSPSLTMRGQRIEVTRLF